jgi:hypothetical protein
MRSILHLQRTIGNQAVQRILQSDSQEPESKWTGPALPRFGHDFGRIPIHSPSTGAIQTKLAINKPRDEYEKEADRAAEQVMRMPRPEAGIDRTAIAHQVMAIKAYPVSSAGAQGDCANCSTTDQSSIIEVEKDTVQASRQSEAHYHKVMSRHTHDPGVELRTSASELISEGHPLPEATRQFFEVRMARDFSAVRLHRGGRASQLNGVLSAKAFTYRNHIWLGPNVGRSPSFTLAHELVHVMQQTSPGGPGPTGASSAPPSIQRDLTPPGNCSQGIHDAMQRLVKAWCDHPSGRACTPADSCHRLQQKVRRNQLCAQYRRTINETCYGGGNSGHRTAEREARRAQATCMALFRSKCTPQPVPHPERQPETEPERAPRRTRQVDQNLLDRMAAATGLTGTALILYLISLGRLRRAF